MDVEKNAPVTVSPLDSCRGRGCRGKVPRIRAPNTRPVKSCGSDTPTTVVIFITPESQAKVGTVNGK